jgi:hypothetical protein
MVDPRTYRERTHAVRVVGLQQFRDDLHVGYAGIKPHIIALAVENHWHSVVDGCSNSIRHCGQNRARLDPLPLSVFPSVPQPGEREQLSVIDFEAKGPLGDSHPRPLVKTVCGNQAPPKPQKIPKRRLRGGSLRPRVYHPHRISERSRRGSFGCCRITGTGCVGVAGRPVVLPISGVKVFPR